MGVDKRLLWKSEIKFSPLVKVSSESLFSVSSFVLAWLHDIKVNCLNNAILLLLT